METNQKNGAVAKSENTKANTSHSTNGLAKKDDAAIIKMPVTKQTDEQAKPEPPAIPQPAKAALALDARLKLVNDLHRRSVQRMNLLARMQQLEAFEIALLQENDELEDNPYQGCKLIIRDDKNRDFLTTTPGLIRMVAQYIFAECDKKRIEIEAGITFPTA